MVGGIPVKYRGGGEGAIASYDFTDLASGTGYEAFYLFVANHGTEGLDCVLTPNSGFYSYGIEMQTQNGANTWTFTSSAFNLPRTVKGTAILNIGIATNGTGDNDTVAATFYKWDGTTPTAITSTFTDTVSSGELMIAFNMPCTETLIKKGESLRLVVTVTATGAEYIWTGFDPAGRAGANVVTTSSRINVPFKVDV